ncbi:MAG: hypothetical protein WBR26_17115 [Candidatus Acidiferrum sp.]
MAEGLEAAKHAIMEQFAVEDMVEGYDPEALCSAIGFNAEGRHFSVRVSQEFDDDYASGQVTVHLSELGEVLRRSKDGKAVVRRDGILPG